MRIVNGDETDMKSDIVETVDYKIRFLAWYNPSSKFALIPACEVLIESFDKINDFKIGIINIMLIAILCP